MAGGTEETPAGEQDAACHHQTEQWDRLMRRGTVRAGIKDFPKVMSKQ